MQNSLVQNNVVLVVEDNPVNMELVTDLLEVAGYRVIQAGTAEEGIALAHTACPSLILMDIQLPGMDGLSATGILKGDAATRDIPVVALTAQAMKGDQERAIAAGCASYLSKPLNTRELPQAVARAIAAGAVTPAPAATAVGIEPVLPAASA